MPRFSNSDEGSIDFYSNVLHMHRTYVRLAERSKAPDSRLTVFPVNRSILVHVCGRGFESHIGHMFCVKKGFATIDAARKINSTEPDLNQ